MMAPGEQTYRVSKHKTRTIRNARRERLLGAVAAIQEANGALSISQAARRFVVPKSTLAARLRGQRDQESYGCSKQKLTPEEETSLEAWVLQLQAWGWPPRVSQLRDMAHELLRGKDDNTKLGANWITWYLSRHPGLKSKYSRTLVQERFLAEDPVIFHEWFELYNSVKAEYGILDKDTYNMDEKGFMMGVAESAKVVFSKHERQAFVRHCGNREWASLIEAVGVRR